jgi:predicted GH43/DUF377 family glycosyl hydrolase
VGWIREGAAFASRTPAEPDCLRELRPWVLQDADETLRMWYSGHDGTTGRILAAARRPGGAWERLGVAIDAGFSGDTDRYSVESPCVVPTPGGYLMAYAGFDGEATRLHMATSDDGRRWTAQGTFMQRGSDEALGASHPCLLRTEAGWWLFFCGYDGSRDSRHAAVLAAVSPTGASWDRVGKVLEPMAGELAVSHPCVIEIARTLYLFYASDDGGTVSIAVASSADGLSWNRHGTVLAASGDWAEAGGVSSPCVLRLKDGSLRMWYAALAGGDDALSYQVHSARFPGPWSL